MIDTRDNMDFLEEELIGKTVLSEKGIPIGVIKKCLIEINAEDSRSIIVSPSKEVEIRDYKSNTGGDIIIPLSRITPIKDVLIFEKNLI
jgi:sporulation protein YlmC with PRC-barrel domain